MSPNAHQRRGLLYRTAHRIWATVLPDFEDTLMVDSRTGLPEKADERYAASGNPSGYSLAWWLCMVIVSLIAAGSVIST